MIEALLRASLRHRLLVMAAAVSLVTVGLLRLVEMPVDVFPDLSAPRVTIVTEATGLAPLEVEQLVTYPIEAAVNGIEGTRRIRSASAAGISIVWVEFDWSTTEVVARQRVTERLQAGAAALPSEAEPPVLAPSSSVMGEIAFVALTSDDVDPMELRRAAERDVRRRLLAVQGVAQVVAIGGDERQYQVVVDPERLARYRLTAVEVTAAIERGSQNAPGGYLVGSGQESVVRVIGRAEGVDEIGSIFIASRGTVPVRVRDVAQVRVAPSVRRGAASHDGTPAVVMSIVRQPAADTLATTERVDQALDELTPSLEQRGIEVHRNLFRQADFIETSVENLFDVLRDGAILVALVLIIFLWHPGATVISVLAIPLSMLSATLVLDMLGLRLDTMTIGGLAIAIGELVDDAIVDVENVARRLRERARKPAAERLPIVETVFEASKEIRSSIVAATAVLMLVFMPLLALTGLEGRLLRPLAISYLVAIFSSLIIAVTVTPVLASWLLPRRNRERGAKAPPMERWLRGGYRPILAWSLEHPGLLIGLSASAVVIGLVGLLSAGRSFLPAFNEGSINLAMFVLPGTSVDQSDALGKLTEEVLLGDPAVVSTARRTGRAERDEHVQGPEASEIDIQLQEDPRSREELLDDLRERLSVVPGAGFTFGQPISHRIDHMLSGQRAALTIRIVGEDLRVLRQTAERTKAAIMGVPGIVDAQVEPIVETPEILIDIDETSAARHGLSMGEAAEAAGLALWGQVAGHVFEDGTATEIVVRYDDDVRTDRARLREVRVPTAAGAAVPLEAIADIRREHSPNYVMRENVRRRVVVTANISGRDLRSTVQEARRRVASEVPLPAGVHREYAGQFEQEEAASQRLLVLGLLVVLGIALIVVATLRSVPRTLIVLVNMPLALAGGVWGVYLAGGVMSIATTIGFITLFGIATRNGILLATRTADLEREGKARREAVLESASERLMPILMTAVTAGLGLLPLGLALGEPGAEIQAPMALVILTGLVSSTALNMMLVPALLARWGGSRPAGGSEAARSSYAPLR